MLHKHSRFAIGLVFLFKSIAVYGTVAGTEDQLNETSATTISRSIERPTNPWRETYVGVSAGGVSTPCSLRIEYDADYQPEEMTLSTAWGNFSVAVDVSGEVPPIFHRTLSFHRQPSFWHSGYDRIAYQEDRYTAWKLLNTPVISIPLAAGWRLETYLIAKGHYDTVIGIQNVFPAIRGLRTYHNRFECQDMHKE